MRIDMRSILALGGFLLLGVSGFGQLTVGESGRYFDDGGKPVVLFGSGIWTIISDVSVDIEEHNRWYAEWGANANRAALYSFFNAVADGEGIGPWPRVGPDMANDGKPKFDLSASDPAFWERSHEYFESCERHGITVWLQIFGEPYVEGSRQRWLINPFNADNHIHPLPGMPSGDGSGEEAFYDPDNAPLMAVQDALVRRLLDETVGRHGNIIYEIGNEINADSVTSKAVAWQQHWIDFFQAYEREHGVRLLLTNNTRRSLFDKGADGFQVVNDNTFGFPRVKGNPLDRMPWEINASILSDFEKYSRPIVNSRPCSDPDRVQYGDIATEAEGRCLYWSTFMSGGHIVGFRTTNESWKVGLKAERIIKHLRGFIDRVPFQTMRPAERLIEDGQALCLAVPPGVYALYLSVGGAVSVRIEPGPERLLAQWYNPRTGEWGQAETVQPGVVRFTAPDALDWALLIEKEALASH